MVSAFNLLDHRIQLLLKYKGLATPTEVQQKAIPAVLKGSHILLIAPTGLGKTEAALLPVFNNFLKLKEKPKGISILYVTPLRALNRDMLRRTIEWGKTLSISISVRHGDTSQAERARQVRKPPDMLITTPETFQILLVGRRLREYLKTVRWVILDEIHELANEERGAQLAVGLERLEELTKEDGHSFQRIGLSATVGSPAEVAGFLGGLENGEPRKVTVIEIDVSKDMELDVEFVTPSTGDATGSSQLHIEPRVFASLKRCRDLIQSHKATLLFVNTRDSAETLGSRFRLWDKGFAIDVHHGSLSKQNRVEAEENFKTGKLKALICTSSLELGIDVGHADFVIQYSSPRQVTRLLQRVGRSGHMIGKTSKGKIIALSHEDFMESVVIARRALNKELEELKIRRNPYIVLAHQIISLALQYREIKTKKAYEVIKRAYPFSTLSWKDFLKVVDQLKGERRINLYGDSIRGRAKSRLYFIDNISMIPDEKSYTVVDITTRKKIGVLDESFVVNNSYEGASFILQGRPWRVVKTDEDSVLVTPVKEIGMIPSWVGEDIPVPFEVAQEVGRLRKKIAGKTSIHGYPCSREDFEKTMDEIHDAEDFAIPSDDTITIEVEGKTMVINACFGTKVNETLGRIISSLLAQRIGESIRMGNDPYRIILEFPKPVSTEDVESTILNINPETVDHLLKIILRNTSFIKWFLIHTAKKFGALSKEFDAANIGMKRLFELFDETIILEETINKILWDRMDVEHTAMVLRRIKNGEIRIVKQGFSPFSNTGYELSRGLTVPQRPENIILDALEKRLEQHRILLLCLNCFHQWRTRVKRAGLHPRCSRCGAIKIALVRENETPVVKKKTLTGEEKKMLKRLGTNASLVVTHGRFALLALAARGVGPSTAARILRKYRFQELLSSEDVRKQFLKDIWNAELRYAETRGFWDNE